MRAHTLPSCRAGPDGPVVKAATDASKLTLGQLRYGGVWLTPIEKIGEQLAVAEGIETALSVMQITKLPTVAALERGGHAVAALASPGSAAVDRCGQ